MAVDDNIKTNSRRREKSLSPKERDLEDRSVDGMMGSEGILGRLAGRGGMTVEWI
jgi:hypothetical protein